jgi:hypothetical protein
MSLSKHNMSLSYHPIQMSLRITSVGIVFIAVLTQTRIIQNLLKIPAKTQDDGWYYGYGYAPLMDVGKVQAKKGWYDCYGNGSVYYYEPFQYSGTESQPRTQTDEQQAHEGLTHETYPSIIINQYFPDAKPLTEEEYPSHIEKQYVPPRHYKETGSTLIPSVTNTLHPSTIDQYQQYYPDYTPTLICLRRKFVCAMKAAFDLS